MGVSAGVAELEGATGGHPEQSSVVQGVIDYYGPTDFIMRSRFQPEKTDRRTGIVYQLLGGPVSEKKDLARLASPVSHVGEGDPPLLIIHGEDDPVVRPAQSERLFELYRQKNLEAELHIVPGKKHGWRVPVPEERQAILDFLARHLTAPR
jgi:dipeptidyl aminopeptidase/acylaminoacyl peptidase